MTRGEAARPQTSRGRGASREVGVQGKSASEALTDSFGIPTIVPFHEGRDISPTLLRQIAKDIGLSVEDFLAAQPGHEPNTAQPTAGEVDAPKKPPEPGRGLRAIR